jgi:hypothetical protein
MVRHGKGPFRFRSKGLEGTVGISGQDHLRRESRFQGGTGCDHQGRSSSNGADGRSGQGSDRVGDQIISVGDFAGLEDIMKDQELSGRQIVEVLRFLTEQIQTNLDNAGDILEQLRHATTKLEERHGSV